MPATTPSAPHLRRPTRRRADALPVDSELTIASSKNASGVRGLVVLLADGLNGIGEGVGLMLPLWCSIGEGVGLMLPLWSRGNRTSPVRDGPCGNNETSSLRGSCGDARISNSSFSRSSAISPAVR